MRYLEWAAISSRGRIPQETLVYISSVISIEEDDWFKAGHGGELMVHSTGDIVSGVSILRHGLTEKRAYYDMQGKSDRYPISLCHSYTQARCQQDHRGSV